LHDTEISKYMLAGCFSKRNSESKCFTLKKVVFTHSVGSFFVFLRTLQASHWKKIQYLRQTKVQPSKWSETHTTNANFLFAF